MSLHYEVVFTCFLREDTPARVLDSPRWHLGDHTDPPAAFERPDGPYPLLSPDPDSYLPGGEFASPHRQLRGHAGVRASAR